MYSWLEYSIDAIVLLGNRWSVLIILSRCCLVITVYSPLHLRSSLWGGTLGQCKHSVLYQNFPLHLTSIDKFCLIPSLLWSQYNDFLTLFTPYLPNSLWHSIVNPSRFFSVYVCVCFIRLTEFLFFKIFWIIPKLLWCLNYLRFVCWQCSLLRIRKQLWSFINNSEGL